MRPDSISVVVPAAGYSSRMGAFKPLLPMGTTTLLERVVALFEAVGPAEVRVVVGYRRHDLAPVLSETGACVVVNDAYDRGMFTSVQAGVANMNSSAHAFFLLPVDIPLVRPTTIAKLLDEALDSEQLIVYPTWNGRRGHPPLISVSLIPEILNWDGEGGLRAVLRRHEDAAVEVSVEDEHILLDADTPEHYADLVRRQALLVTPPTAECEAILSCRFRSKPEVADHCRKVASVARRLGLLLVQMGHELDLDLMNAGAMLHDIAKGFPNHPEKGARLLRKMGYPGVAELIACHMDCTWTKGQPVTAKQVVYLADKLTAGNAMIPLALKFEQSAIRLSRDSTALSALEQRRQTAEAIKESVEEIMGRSLEEIFPELKANRFHEPPNDPPPETR